MLRGRRALAPIAPSPDQVHDPGMRNGRPAVATHSIFPSLISVPVMLWALAALLIGSSIKIQTEVMTEPVRVTSTWQFFAAWVSFIPIMIMTWFVSSMADGAYNGVAQHPRAQTANTAFAILIAIGHICIVWSDTSPFVRRGGHAATSPQIYALWIFGFLLSILLVCLAHWVFKNLRISLVVREAPKGGAAKYMIRFIPRYGMLTLIQVCLLGFVVSYTQTFEYVPTIPGEINPVWTGSCTHIINATYMSTYCRPSDRGFQFVGHIESPVHFGLPAMDCDDGGAFPETDIFKSLFDACENGVRTLQMGSSLSLGFCSGVLFVAVVFVEFIATIDDEMTVWNWVTRARNWEANEKTSRGAAAWSGPRIITAVVCAALGALLTLLGTLFVATLMVMNYKSGPDTLSIYGGLLVPAFLLWVLAFFLVLYQLRHRRLYKFEVSPEQKKEQEHVRAEIALEDANRVCGFWFVKANFVREYKGTTLPRFQALLHEASEPLGFVQVSHADAYGQQALRSKYLAISHRWLEPTQPDRGGEQMRKLKDFLSRPEGQSVDWIW